MSGHQSNRAVLVAGAFDDLRSLDLRFLQEAARYGPVTVFVWSDAAVAAATHSHPKFRLPERLYVLNAVRFVSQVIPLNELNDMLSINWGASTPICIEREDCSSEQLKAFCRQQGLEYRLLSSTQLLGFPKIESTPSLSPRKKLIVTGCYDWLHSGHVRFFEEASALGDLYVVVGHDANIRLLKGEGHPLLPQEERRYLTGSIRFVTESLIATGDGWLDAEPEIRRLKPDIYVVNEDGDRGGKREYCLQQGIEYVVLKRIPAPGLPQRSSTELRGF